MKKLTLGLAFVALGSLYAADIQGIIQNIDAGKKTITVGNNVVKIMPYTKIEQDSCGIGWDVMKKFTDLKVGDLVEIDPMYDANTIVAEEIEIKCMNNRAY